jgi:hypothetical protein
MFPFAVPPGSVSHRVMAALDSMYASWDIPHREIEFGILANFGCNLCQHCGFRYLYDMFWIAHWRAGIANFIQKHAAGVQTAA